MLTVVMLVLMTDIATRKTVGVSILGTIDLTQLAVMSCVFLSLPLAFLREAHVGVDFVTDPLPPRFVGALKLAAALAGAALLAAITFFSWRQAMIQLRQHDVSNTLGIPMIAYWTPLLVGCALSAGAALVAGLRAFAGTWPTR